MALYPLAGTKPALFHPAQQEGLRIGLKDSRPNTLQLLSLVESQSAAEFLSLIDIGGCVISYRDVCSNEGVALGYGGYGLRPIAHGLVCVLEHGSRLRAVTPPAPVVKTSNSEKRNQVGVKQTRMRDQIFDSPGAA